MDILVANRLDFNEWMELASRDPDAFEARRREAVQELIDSSPRDRRERLRCLQWRIDRIREKSNNPMAGCLSLYGMMWDSVMGAGGLAEALNQFSGGVEPAEPRRNAEIIRFPSHRLDS